MSYKGNSEASVSIKKLLKYPEGSFSAALKAVLGPPTFADLYSSGECRMKWMRVLTNGEKIKVLEIRDKYLGHFTTNRKTKTIDFHTDWIEKGTATSFVVKVIAHPDQF